MMLLVTQYQEACERAAVLVCTAVWRPAHLPEVSHSNPQRQAGVGGGGADLLGLVVGVHIIDTVQPSIKPHLPPSFWEDAELVFLPARENTKLC